jgi:hypothetical protein
MNTYSFDHNKNTATQTGASKMNEKQTLHEFPCAVGLINGMILSLPLWGFIYFLIRMWL